tara:strand:- start:1450 stop:1788 length:339 start_codon:yes stop_codon:yes gene_type:complete
MVFEFKSTETLKDIVKISLKGERFYPYSPSEVTTEEGIWLVKDEGVYVMPSIQIEGKPPVVYAEGFGADCEYIGGDDYAEFVSLSAGQIERLLVKNASLLIQLTDTEIKVGV